MTRILQQEKKSTINALSLFAIATLGLHTVTVVMLIFQGFAINNEVSNKKPLSLVQLVDGREQPQTEPLERKPEAIRQFVGNTMTAMFNWSSTLPPTTIDEVKNPKTDPGITIRTPQGATKKVTTTSWVASFGLAEDFRRGFLEQIADITPPEVFSKNEKQALGAQLVIERIDPPAKIAEGRWRVGMVANIVQERRSDNKKLITPYNKDLLVRAVEYYEHPLSNRLSEVQKAIYDVRAQKLEIYEISDLCLTDPYGSGNESNRCGSDVKSENFTQ